jgi:uncharacterized membrane protein
MRRVGGGVTTQSASPGVRCPSGAAAHLVQFFGVPPLLVGDWALVVAPRLLWAAEVVLVSGVAGLLCGIVLMIRNLMRRD